MTLKSPLGFSLAAKHSFEPEAGDHCPMTPKGILPLALGAVIVCEHPRLREWIKRKKRPRPRPLVVVGSASRRIDSPYD
jgi:hypothetical protein